jgi:ABC-type phosphate transport system auxiliary subunit
VIVIVTLKPGDLQKPFVPTVMSVCTNEQVSSQERQAIWAELQSLGQDTQAFRVEAYRLRTAGSLDTTENERLRAKQSELEQRGEALIKRSVPLLHPLLPFSF